MQRGRFLVIKSLLNKAISNYFFSSFFPDGKNFVFFHSQTYEPKNDSKKIVLTCEHASSALPPGYTWANHDIEKYRATHWAYDIK